MLYHLYLVLNFTALLSVAATDCLVAAAFSSRELYFYIFYIYRFIYPDTAFLYFDPLNCQSLPRLRPQHHGLCTRPSCLPIGSPAHTQSASTNHSAPSSAPTRRARAAWPEVTGHGGGGGAGIKPTWSCLPTLAHRNWPLVTAPRRWHWLIRFPVVPPGLPRSRSAMVVSPPPRLRLFQVVFSDPSRSFYCSGEKLSGFVRIEAAQPCRVTRLCVTAAGCARVDHRRGKNRKGRSQEVEYLKYEEELRLEEALSPDADGGFLLQAQKTYSFQFGFELPAAGHLVSSFRGKFGFVRYYVRAELHRPQDALQVETEFEVEEPLDVNQPDLLAPAAASRQRKVTCLFIPDGQVSITARIDRKGFCEGEDISINAKFENTCSRIVVPKAAIVAKHSYIADGHTKEVRQKLSAVRGNHIISGMCDMWQGKSIRVPKLRPSLLGCDIIKVDYALMVYLHIPGSEKLVLELPLVIGTVPLSGVSRTSSLSSHVGSQTSSWASFPSAPPSYCNIHRDLRVDEPCTPLLHDYDDGEDQDDDDGGLFMRAPQGSYPPPPAYREVDQDSGSPHPALQVF